MIEFTAAGAAESTIINRREIMPLLARARRIADSYEKATGCRALVLDRGGYSGPGPHEKKPYPFCAVCGKYRPPCACLHTDALAKSRRGSSLVYTCEIGFGYWTSPLYAGERYAGALAAGQVLTIPREEAAEKFSAFCGGAVNKKLLEDDSGLVTKTREEIQAMARLLLICAKKVSEGYGSAVSAREKAPGEGNPMKLILTCAGSETQKVPENSGAFPEGERILLAALRRGDKDAAAKIIDDLLDAIQKTVPPDFEALRLRSVELAVLLSRAADENLCHDAAYSRCFRRLQESTSNEELKTNLRCIVDRAGGKIFRFQGIRHASAIRRAERFIWKNYTRKLSLGEIAQASGLSAPYFSTVFREEMGENLSSYLNRLRVEKAACLLTETVRSLNEIAAECGFEDQSWFSKIFKSRMGMSPGKFREQGSIDNALKGRGIIL